MNINKIFFNVIEEQNILKTTKTKPIVDAIKNRNMITFYYSGPQKPKKDSVKNGYRVKAEAVALGLSKKGNLIVTSDLSYNFVIPKVYIGNIDIPFFNAI